MSVSPYFSDVALIASLRKYYKKKDQYSVNFKYWLHTAKKTKDGILINVGSRKFLVDFYTGSVIKEVKINHE